MPHRHGSSTEELTAYTLEGSSMVCFQTWRARHLMPQRRRRQNDPPEDPSSQNTFLNNHVSPNEEIWQNAGVPAQRPGNRLSCPGRNGTPSWGQQPQGYQVSHQQETCVQTENISYGTRQAASSADNFQVGPAAGGTQAGAWDGGPLYNHSQLPVSDYASANGGYAEGNGLWLHGNEQLRMQAFPPQQNSAPGGPVDSLLTAAGASQAGAWDGGPLYNHSQLPVSDYAPANGGYAEGNGLWLHGNEQLRMQVFPPQQNSAPGGPVDSFLMAAGGTQAVAGDGGPLYNHSQLPVSDYAPANGCYAEGNGLWLHGNEQLRMQAFPPQQNSAPGGPMDSFLTPQRSSFSGESSSTAYWGSTSDLSSCSTHHSQ
ncbi:uncharacterized protein LOC144588354 [Pogona vitticeps]